MFNGGQSHASIFIRFAHKFAQDILDSLDNVKNLIHPYRLNHELYSKSSFHCPQLFLLVVKLSFNAKMDLTDFGV